MDEAMISFISELGRKISEYSGDLFTVVTFSSESSCSFGDITPFSSMRRSRLKIKSTRSHPSLVSVFLVFNPGDLYYLGYKIIIIIIIMQTERRVAANPQIKPKLAATVHIRPPSPLLLILSP